LIENQSQWAVLFKAFLLEIYYTPFEQRLKYRPEIGQKYENLLELAQGEEPPPVKTGKRGRYKHQ